MTITAPRVLECYEFIKTYHGLLDKLPSRAEIAEEMGVGGARVSQYLTILYKEGYLTKESKTLFNK